jgi:hypothetical protein
VGETHRVYNSPPGSPPFGPSPFPSPSPSPSPSPAVYTSSSLQDYSCPHFPWHWGFFRGLARESIVPERGGSLVVARLPSVSRPTALRPNPHLRLSRSIHASPLRFTYSLCKGGHGVRRSDRGEASASASKRGRKSGEEPA